MHFVAPKILKCLKCDNCKLFCWIYNRSFNSSVLLLTFFVVAKQTAIVKQTIHCCYFYKMILLLWRQWLNVGTTLFFYYSHCMYCKICKMNCMSCQPLLSIKPFFLAILHDNFVFFTKVAKIWNFSWVLTQEFWSLLNIDNHTKPYDLQYLANRMKALTNRTEDC